MKFFPYICNCVALDTGMCTSIIQKMALHRLAERISDTARSILRIVSLTVIHSYCSTTM